MPSVWVSGQVVRFIKTPRMVNTTDSPEHMQGLLRDAIGAAMECDSETWREMVCRARRSKFSVANWKREVCSIYQIAMKEFGMSKKKNQKTPELRRSGGLVKLKTRMFNEWEFFADDLLHATAGKIKTAGSV